MEKPIDDGGPAFPQRSYEVDASGAFCNFADSSGMSLRDFFAGQAMITLVPLAEKTDGTSYVEASTQAYRFADAMLAAREKAVSSDMECASDLATAQAVRITKALAIIGEPFDHPMGTTSAYTWEQAYRDVIEKFNQLSNVLEGQSADTHPEVHDGTTG
jgi:hypothetical protein